MLAFNQWNIMEASTINTVNATTTATEAEAAAKAAADAEAAAKKAAEARLASRLAAPRFHNETVLTVSLATKAEMDVYQTLQLVDSVRGQLGTLASLALDNMSLTVRRPDKDGGIKGTGKGTFDAKETLGSQISRLTRECERFAKATGIELPLVLSRSLDGETGSRLVREAKSLVA